MTLTTLGYPRATTLRKINSQDYDSTSLGVNVVNPSIIHSRNLRSSSPSLLTDSNRGQWSTLSREPGRVLIDDQLAKQLGVTTRTDDRIARPSVTPLKDSIDRLQPKEYNYTTRCDNSSNNSHHRRQDSYQKDWLYSSTGLSHHNHNHIHPTPQIQRPSQTQLTRRPSQPASHLERSAADHLPRPPISQNVDNHLCNSDNDRQVFKCRASPSRSNDQRPPSLKSSSSSSESSSCLTNDSSPNSSLQKPIPSTSASVPPPPLLQPILDHTRFVPTPSNRRMGFSEEAAREVIPSHTDSTSFDLSSSQLFIDPLLQLSLIALESIWPQLSTTSPASHQTISDPLKSRSSSSHSLLHFIKEVLKRSRTNSNTLKIALFYIHQSRRSIRRRIAHGDFSQIRYQQHLEESSCTASGSDLTRRTHHGLNKSDLDSLVRTLKDPMLSGKKTFLAALMCASKYLQDRNFSNRAWAKISSVPIQEINHNERVFLEMIDYKLHVELDAFNIWSIRLRKLIEEKRPNAQARTASKEPILAPTAQLSLTLSSDQITSTKLEGSRESLPSSQASSTASLTRRPTISRPVDRLASSPVVSHSRVVNDPSSSNPPARQDSDYSTPLRQQSYNIVSRDSFCHLSAPHQSCKSSSNAGEQRNLSSVPHRQVTTPLISRPKGYSAISHSSLIHDPPTLDTPTKATRAPNLGGLSRSLLSSSLSHLREDEGVGNKKIAIKETSTLNYPSYTNRTLQESSRLPTFSSSSLKTGSEIRKVTAEDVIRAERELLERIAREKNFLENDNVARLVIKGDRGMITDELMQSPENLTNQKDLKKRSVAISGIRSELSKERIRNMVATTTDRGAARMTKIETAKLGGLGDNANGMDLKPNPGRKGHDLKADEIAKEVINAQYNLNTPASHRRASEGTRSERPNLAMEKTFLATPIEAVRSFKYQQPRVALEELKIGYPVSRSNSTNLREDKAKVKQTMERQGMNFCGMQDRDKLKSEISMPLHTTATTSSLVPRGNETGRNKYQASMVDGQGGPSMYGDHYHSLNYSRVGGRPIY